LLIWLMRFNLNRLTVKDSLLNVLMMNKLLGNVAIDGSYWTLTYEVLFYASAAIVFFGLRIRRIEWACLAWLAVGFVARISGFNANHLRLGVLLGVEYCHFFILGMMIYRVSGRRHTRLTVITMILAYLMTLFGPDYNPGDIRLWQYMLMSACFVLIVWLIAEKKLLFLNVWPLLFLGEISYSLYLIHQVAGYWGIQKLEGLGWNPTIVLLFSLICAIAAATCVRKLVEVPAQNLIRNWYRETHQKDVSDPHRAVEASVNKITSHPQHKAARL
jgi:peptidoglycan/LPS O-acetylase OafA/YrhL